MIKENYESFCINKLEKNKEMKCVMENNIILKGTNIFQLDNKIPSIHHSKTAHMAHSS